jgi:hypothetical protein
MAACPDRIGRLEQGTRVSPLERLRQEESLAQLAAERDEPLPLRRRLDAEEPELGDLEGGHPAPFWCAIFVDRSMGAATP